ncbi:MAG: aminotransferase class IV, partial [Bacteroidota bacterium]
MSDQQNRLIHFNDEIIRHDHAMVSLANRSFLFGDGLFETIRTLGTEMPFFSYHYERLLKGMTLLKMNIPVSW